EQGVWIHDMPGVRSEPAGKADLGLAFGLPEEISEAGVLGQGDELAKLLHLGHPALADGIGKQSSQERIGHQEPAPRGGDVRLVVEALREYLCEVLQYIGAEQPRVYPRNTVRAVTANHSEVGHAHLPHRPFFDEAHARKTALLVRKPAAEIVEEAAVDLVD